MNKPKVLVLTSSYPKWRGDINGNFVYELADRLKEDFDISILAPAYKDSLLYEEVDGIKINRHKQFFIEGVELAYGSDILAKVHRNKLYLLVIPVYLLMQFLAIHKIVKRENISMIHAHWLLPQGLIAVLYKLLLNRKVKILATVHGADLNSFNNAFGAILKRFTLKNLDGLTVVSEALKKAALRYGYNKDVFVYPMGVDTTLFTTITASDLKAKLAIKGELLLFVGSVIERKGVRYLLQAMPAVIKSFPALTLVIAGDGNLMQEMKALSKNLDIGSQVKFLGAVEHNDLPAYFAVADVFTLPSFSEGWPVVVMEAISSGKACVVSDIASFKDMNERFIIKAKAGDKNDLAKKIIEGMTLARNEASIAARAREYALSNFDWKVIARRYKELYVRLCGIVTL